MGILVYRSQQIFCWIRLLLDWKFLLMQWSPEVWDFDKSEHHFARIDMSYAFDDVFLNSLLVHLCAYCANCFWASFWGLVNACPVHNRTHPVITPSWYPLYWGLPCLTYDRRLNLPCKGKSEHVYVVGRRLPVSDAKKVARNIGTKSQGLAKEWPKNKWPVMLQDLVVAIPNHKLTEPQLMAGRSARLVSYAFASWISRVISLVCYQITTICLAVCFNCQIEAQVLPRKFLVSIVEALRQHPPLPFRS